MKIAFIWKNSVEISANLYRIEIKYTTSSFGNYEAHRGIELPGEKGKRGKGEKGKRGKREKGKRGKGEKGKRGNVDHLRAKRAENFAITPLRLA